LLDLVGCFAQEAWQHGAQKRPPGAPAVILLAMGHGVTLRLVANALQSRIKDLLATSDSSSSPLSPPLAGHPPSSQRPASAQSSSAALKSGQSIPSKSPPQDDTVSVPHPKPDVPPLAPATTTQYRVVPPPPVQRSMLPPKVLSARE
jgi:hypothetical protein